MTATTRLGDNLVIRRFTAKAQADGRDYICYPHGHSQAPAVVAADGAVLVRGDRVELYRAKLGGPIVATIAQVTPYTRYARGVRLVLELDVPGDWPRRLFAEPCECVRLV